MNKQTSKTTQTHSNNKTTTPQPMIRRICLLAALGFAECFQISPTTLAHPRPPTALAFLPVEQQRGRLTTLPRMVTSTQDESSASSAKPPKTDILAIVAPLKFVGPYPCLSLNFPNTVSTSTESKTTTKTLDFLLDTGANVNSIDEETAKEMNLDLVMSHDEFAMGSVGLGGSQQAGDIYRLGDSELAGLPHRLPFIKNLMAAAFPHASPVGSGILGLNMFQSVPAAGVEFDWHGTDGDPPTIIFYTGNELPDFALANLTARVPLELHKVAQLFTLNVTINNVSIPALLDTGAPATIMNPQAAQLARIETFTEKDLKEWWSTQQTKAQFPGGHHPMTVGDHFLPVGGLDGRPVLLARSQSMSIPIQAGPCSLGQGPVYVGNFPGLSFISGGDVGKQQQKPAIVLGLDSLARSYRMILRAKHNEVWFEELSDQVLP